MYILFIIFLYSHMNMPLLLSSQSWRQDPIGNLFSLYSIYYFSIQYSIILTVSVQYIYIILKSNMDPNRFLTFHNNFLAMRYNAVPRAEKKIDIKNHTYV